MGTCSAKGVLAAEVHSPGHKAGAESVEVVPADAAGAESLEAVPAGAAGVATLLGREAGLGGKAGDAGGRKAPSDTAAPDASLRELTAAHEPELVHSLVAASLTSLEWRGATHVPMWLNQFIKRMWPTATDAIEKKVKEEAIPAIQDNLPDWISGHVQLDRFKLGDEAPPRLDGIRCMDTDKGIKIAIGIDYWSGCDIAISVGVLSLGISELKIAGCVIVELAPLVGALPVVGALDIYFMDPPSVQYKFTGIGRMAELPVLKSAVRHAFDTVIQGQLVMPNSVVVPLVQEDTKEIRQARMRKPIGVLRVTPLSASGLPCSDVGFFTKGQSDPYVRTRLASRSASSSVVRRTTSPVWPAAEEHQDFVVYDLTQQVIIEVLDHDVCTSDDSLGVARPMGISDALAASGAALPLFEGIKYNRGGETLMRGADRGTLRMRFDWLNVVEAAPAPRSLSAVDGHILKVEIGDMHFPANIAKTVKVQIRFDGQTATTRGVATRSQRLKEAAASVDASIVAVVRKGSKLGICPDTLAQQTGLDVGVIAKILAEEHAVGHHEMGVPTQRHVTTKLRYGRCLTVKVADLGAFSSTCVEFLALNSSNEVLARTSLDLKGTGLSWPPGDADSAPVQLRGDGGVSAWLDVRASACLQLGAPPEA